MHRRLLLAILLAVVVTAAALGIPLGITGWQLVGTIAREDLLARAQRIAATLDSEIVAGERLSLDAVRIAVPEKGRLTVRAPGTGVLRYDRPETRPREVRGQRGEDDPAMLVQRVPIARGGTVTLAVPAAPVHNRQTQVTLGVLIVVLLSIAVGTVVATVTARRLAKPLRHVADRAARLGGGDFRLDPTRHRVAELDKLAEALDSSATALAQLIQRERQLVGDVSHQLRSRLTALGLHVESLAAHPDADVHLDAEAAQQQLDRLEGVLAELLEAERAASEADTEAVDLSTMLAELAEEWGGPLWADGRELRTRVATGLRARATPARLREVVGVLLDNALRHGAGTVTLAARKAERMVVVEVRDEGEGVPEQLAEHIFDRGVSAGGSTGVGLALARALAEADGGRLELSERRPPAFRVFLRTPQPGELEPVDWPAERTPR